ncbi:MAG: GAF domain-containing protein [Leptospiraceae bacterium]|nr:GAF domain-containing protein [Leptospiraceae bacterium]
MNTESNKNYQVVEFEWIISGIAKAFIRNEEIDLAISSALAKIGKMSDASRAYVFEFHKDRILMSNTYEWCNTDVTPEINNLKDLPVNMFPWWTDKLNSGKILYIGDVSQLPPEAKAEKEILEMQSILSVLVLPLHFNGMLQGFVGFDHCNKKYVWSRKDESLLNILSELFSNAFARKEKEKLLSESNAQLTKALDELKTLQNQMIVQEHMVAIGHLAAGVAHEINNPLGYVISNTNSLTEYVKVLMNECNSSKHPDMEFIREDIPELLSETEEGLNRVKKIVDSLRFFSRVDMFNDYEAYDIRLGIENTLIMLNNRLKYIAELKIEIPENIPTIYANGGKINQVILNLLVNAIDAIEDRKSDDKGLIVISVDSYDTHIKLKISDSGVGISQENMAHIFKPFFTTKPTGRGTGFGLSIAYDIVTNIHRGKIEVQSTPGEGSTFVVTLPVEQEKV